MKKVHIIGGGTVHYVRNHLALAAPAYGNTARTLYKLCQEQNSMAVCLHLTRMAGGTKEDFMPDGLETNSDVSDLVDELCSDPNTKIIFMPVALCDFYGTIGDSIYTGKYGERVNSREFHIMSLTPAHKIISNIRQNRHCRHQRKDIFLVGFKMTNGANENEQYIAGLNLCKEAACNLVLANDVLTKLNMVITPEEAKYHVTTDKNEALKGLVEMAYLRSHLTFTRSTVVDGKSVAWDSELVPASLREVVNYCIQNNAYKPFRGVTAGHFAVKVDDNTFLTSQRKTNFNDLAKIGLVKVVTDGPDSVIAYGSKPSVGGQSQRIVFHEHQDYDCIVHFHSPKKDWSKVPTISQREYECGSMQCGNNTSSGLKKFGNLSAVYLDNHGPNIVFHRSIDPKEVIKFIEDNFILSMKTGGPV